MIYPRPVARPLRLVLAWACLFLSGPWLTGAEVTRSSFSLPGGDAAETLRQLARQARESVVYPIDLVRGVQTHPVQGEFTGREAAERMTAGTALFVSQDTQTSALVIARRTPPQPAAVLHFPSPQPSPPPMKPKTIWSALRATIGLVLVPASSATAADGGVLPTGTITGRVQNAVTGEFLNNARVVAEGTQAEVFTDQTGEYRLMGLPAGLVRVSISFTGLQGVTESISLASGVTERRDFSLHPVKSRAHEDAGAVVRLSDFVVGASREMNAAAIAINEQRHAPNLKQVVSTDEYGNIAEGNIAEFLKFVPGITVGYTGGNAREISINGTPSANVPISVGGFGFASASVDTSASRAVQVDMLSLNALARIEVSYSPTPETPGGALAGSVNLVPRNAFERAQPVINSSVYVMMRDNARDFQKVPGPKPKPTRNVHPGFDFSWVNPVSRRFGYTLTLGHSSQLSSQDLTQMAWRGTLQPTNGVAFPHTTPDQPYLTTYAFGDSPKVTARNSAGLTLDGRLSPRDTLTFGLQYSSFTVDFRSTIVTFNVGRVLPGGFSLWETRGANRAGNIQMAAVVRHRVNRTLMPTFVWRHHGQVWKSELGVGLSRQKDSNPDDTRGFFRNVTASRTDLTVAFQDLQPMRPGSIQLLDGATGQPVNPHALSTYTIASTSLDGRIIKDEQRTAYWSANRYLPGRWPVALKGGLDFRQSLRDASGGQSTFNFVGADGRASSVPSGGDDQALPFLDPVFSRRIPNYGWPRTDTIASESVYRQYLSNPSHFVGNSIADYRNAATFSRHLSELISAAYLRSDVALFGQRLKLVGGLRAEQTNIKAEGPFTDPTRNFQRRADGTFVLGPAGRPLPVATDALQVLRATLVPRGMEVDKEYLRLFPSLNASMVLGQDWIARAAYYHSVGRPDMNQYAGGLTVPDTDRPSGPGNYIVVNNAAIKPWNARCVTVRLERYFEGVGQISVGAFRRDIQNFFGNTITAASPAFLALYDLDPATYGNYEVSTQENIPGTVRMTGLDVNYKQALTFLPPWARGIQVFANGSAQRATGARAQNFAGYVPRSASWGASFTRERFNVRANWNYRGQRRIGQIASGASIAPDTFTWDPSRRYLDLSGEFHLTPRFALFATLRNFTNERDTREVYGSATPAVARFRQAVDYASLWTFGLKGRF